MSPPVWPKTGNLMNLAVDLSLYYSSRAICISSLLTYHQGNNNILKNMFFPLHSVAFWWIKEYVHIVYFGM